MEAFLGKGVILKTKLPASRNVAIELDPKVLSRYWRRRSKSVQFIEGDALTVLPALKLDASALVYADPPYLGTVRTDKNRVYYGRELMTQEEHQKLLHVLTSLEAMVMVSGYQSELYCRQLNGWRMETKWTVTRGGTRVQECLWMNFAPPIFLHDTRFIGSDFTDRQGAKRKIARWKNRFARMEAQERFAILEALTAMVDDGPSQLKIPPSRLSARCHEKLQGQSPL